MLRSGLERCGMLLDSIDFFTSPQQRSKAVEEALKDTLDKLDILISPDFASSALISPSESKHGVPALFLLTRIGPDTLDEAASYIRLQDAPSESNATNDVIDSLSTLNKCLERCDRAIEDPTPVSPIVGNIDSEQVRFTPWVALIRHLQRNLSDCPDTHVMRLLLCNVHPTDKQSWESDALRLLCHCTRAPAWHPVDFHVNKSRKSSLPEAREESSQCLLCPPLIKKVKHRALKFCYDEQQIWRDRVGVKIEDNKGSPQLQSLRTWLGRARNREHRKALQCVLARWLSRSYGTPCLPQTWNLDSIFLDENLDVKSHLYPYTEYTLLETLADLEPGRIDSAFMIRFAILMLRIEFPTLDLDIADEDELDADELDECLQGFLEQEDISGELEGRFRRVIEFCQDWNDSDPPQLHLIEPKVFGPLIEELRWRWVADIPDVAGTAESSHAVFSTTTEQVQRTRSNEVDFYRNSYAVSHHSDYQPDSPQTPGRSRGFSQRH
ncbi:hypothetical protein AMS68_003315 [Peltaster fructicola]|uniref:DUF7580 domain-containing protein n=1 Tax=Peltaster fructicola TaxID=286661 RepID=A0A6H0XT55_9PEZI|nr:hypothetical protein AMS68_003315 [Peltaster fructicola]